MKKLIQLILIVTITSFFIQCTTTEESTNSLIPLPVSVEMGQQSFLLRNHTELGEVPEDLMDIYNYFKDQVSDEFGISLSESTKNSKIGFLLDSNLPDSIGSEGYSLVVRKDGIQLKARERAGLFYGVQTLLQLINEDGSITACKIDDSPRFVWRGFMLDVSRHFFPKEYIFKVIDYLAMHKLNRLHLHLTDDQGWRIEIKKYPRLTEVGAWRVDRENMHWNAREKQKPGEKATYGGFYTQDDIREIVKYAGSRYVTVIPEIEMPGHTTAALAAYPEYSCTGGPFTVLPGGVWPITDIYCAGKDETFTFLQDILTEVMDLFPSKYIHIGGDEADKKEWELCADCQKRIRQEGLKDEHELQSYFITRIEKFLNANGRQLIGWDEILEGGLAPNAAVMSWRGVAGGIKAAKAGHPVVMSPGTHCYFDHYQGKPELEPPAIGGYLPLEKVYSYEPVPEELNEQEASYILGVQANLWSEYIPDTKQADYMAFPRLCALAEVAWSPAEKKNYDDFAQRLLVHLGRLDHAGIHYSKSFANVEPATQFNDEAKTFTVQLSNSLNIGEIKFTLDGSDPDQSSEIYSGPFTISKTTVVKAATYLNDLLYSGIAREKVWIHQATGAHVSFLNKYSDKYTGGGDMALTNSLRGSVNLGDGRWQGYSHDDMQVILDLGSEKLINSIALGCLQTIGSWVFFPKFVQISISDDGKNFTEIGQANNDLSLRDPERKIQNFKINLEPANTRYIKVFAKNQGDCPDWHSGAGNAAWLFVDEIIVE